MSSTLKTTLTQIRRTPYQALAAIMVLTLTFLTGTIFTFLFFGAQKVLQHFESAPQVIAFFTKGEDLSTTAIADIKTKLEESGKLASFKYVSTREAEAIYKEKNKNDPLLLELVDYKILPPSIEISAKKIGDLDDLKDILAKQPKVTDVVFYEDVVNTLNVWINNLRLVGLALVVYLSLQSILILILIVSLKILTKREEIEILQLLGASFWFIAKPFLLEGVIYGIIGALLGFVLATSLLLYATPIIVDWLGEIPLLPIPYTFLGAVLGLAVVLGAILGMIASLMGVRRFIKY